jgi:hypothetical protein
MEVENLITMDTLRPAAPLFFLLLLIIFASIAVSFLTRGMNKGIILFYLL